MQPTLDDFAMRLIRRAARRLIGKFGFTAADRSELEQELALDVFRRLRSADQDLDEPNAFVTTVVKNSVMNLLEHRNAKKRRQPPCRSLNAMIRGPEGGKVELAETINEDRRLAHRSCFDCGEQERQEMAHDVAEVLKRLPPDLRESVEALMRGEPLNQVADAAGIPRSTLRERLQRIFKAAGFSNNIP